MHTEPLNILLTVPRLNAGGAETYTAMLAKHLHHLGHKVSVASGGGSISQQLEQEGISQYNIPFKLHVGLSTLMLKRVIRKVHPDVVHANAANAAVVTAKACTSMAVPWVMTAHGRLFRHQTRYHHFGSAHKIICVSDFLRRDIIAEGIYPAELLTTIPNGVELNRFMPSASGEAMRGQLHIPADAFTVGHIGRMFSPHRKGHHTIIKLLATHSECANWHAVMIGSGRYLQYFQDMACELNVADRVHFLGARQDIPDILPAVDAVALPTFSETFGLSLAEAMACEKPTVAYAVGGVPEVVEQNKTGFLVPYMDDEALADRLVWLSTHRAEAIQMGQAGRQRIEQYFSVDKMADRIITVYYDAKKVQCP